MSYFVQKPGFIDNRVMWADIIKELTSNGGFTLISVDGSTLVPTINDVSLGIDSAVIQATPLVDMLAEDQPWRICVKVTKDETQLYCATPKQIGDDGTVAVAYKLNYAPYDSNSKDANIYSGCIGNVWNKTVDPNLQSYRPGATHVFFSRGALADINNNLAADPGTFGYDIYGNTRRNAQGKVVSQGRPNVYSVPTGGALDSAQVFDFVQKALDYKAYPFSYAISCTDHGLAFASWIEGTDSYGCTQNWFCVQRAINSDGSVVTTGKAPLLCIYSVNGGGGTPTLVGLAGLKTLAPAEVDAYGIMRFVVREADVNAPTLAIPASIHTPDGNAVINPLTQVCFNENGRYDFKFPQGFNTARHSYAYQLDMIAYTSADVCSQRIDVQVQVYNEKNVDGTPKLRTYRALSANSPNNTGMRPFMLVPTV